SNNVRVTGSRDSHSAESSISRLPARRRRCAAICSTRWFRCQLTDNWSSSSSNVVGQLASNEGLYVDMKDFNITKDMAKGDPSAKVRKLGARKGTHGTIIFRAGDTLTIWGRRLLRCGFVNGRSLFPGLDRLHRARRPWWRISMKRESGENYTEPACLRA